MPTVTKLPLELEKVQIIGQIELVEIVFPMSANKLWTSYMFTGNPILPCIWG